MAWLAMHTTRATTPPLIAWAACERCYSADASEPSNPRNSLQMGYTMTTNTVRKATLTETPMNEFPLMEASSDNVVLFHPHVSPRAADRVAEVLTTRWIGQGPRVEEFEHEFSERFGNGLPAVAVGSGTDALHLSYILAGLQPGDEVIAPIFTCTATNIPFLYMGVNVVFADVQPHTLNVDPVDVRRRITANTKAIVCVHYGGLPCDMVELQDIADEFGLKIIQDAAHALGATYLGREVAELSDFSIFSFQAIKHITTGDGGMIVMKDRDLADKGERIRWFGIDRKAKQAGIWQNDIYEVGYKYQMTDISAALGLAGLSDFDRILAHRQALLAAYERGLADCRDVQVVGLQRVDRTHA